MKKSNLWKYNYTARAECTAHILYSQNVLNYILVGHFLLIVQGKWTKNIANSIHQLKAWPNNRNEQKIMYCMCASPWENHKNEFLKCFCSTQLPFYYVRMHIAQFETWYKLRLIFKVQIILLCACCCCIYNMNYIVYPVYFF